MARVELRNVWKFYGDVEACKDVSWKCENGEFFSLLGPSGCGKSSTMRMIAGLEEISRGDIFFDDKRVNDIPPGSRNVALVFENWALYPNMTVFDNIAFPLWVRKMPKEDIEKKVQWATDFLGLSDVLNKNVKNLSGGQQQRVAIGRAIVREPEVMLMDEPISHLDANLRLRMREELENLERKLGITTIYVTHDQAESMALADRIAVMNKGVIQQIGTPKDIYYFPRNLFVAQFIGEPPINVAECEIAYENGCIKIISESFRIKLDQYRYKEISTYKGPSKVKLAIRPENIYVVPSSTSDSADAEVTFVENQGERIILSLRLKGGEDFLVVVHDEVKPGIGSIIHIKFDKKYVHLFDCDTGNNLFLSE